MSAAARDGQTALALRLARHLAPSSPTDAAGGNVAFSPASVHAALALVAAGARGDTLAQLLAFLGASSAAELADFGRLVSRIFLADRASSDGPRVLFGGGLWLDASRCRLTDAFREVAAECYMSEARTVDFAGEPKEAVKTINEWVKTATGNLIDTIIAGDDIDAETDLVLANAVYFKGQWRHNSFRSTSFTETFHRLDGSHVKAESMVMKHSTQKVACMDGFKVLKLPYKPGRQTKEADRQPPAPGQRNRRRGSDKMPDVDGDDAQYSMFIFLPDELDGITAMVDTVTAAPASLYGILGEMKNKHVYLRLPKFKIDFTWERLGCALGQLGLTLPFSPETADLSGMYEAKEDVDGSNSSRWPPFLTKFTHMAVVDVNEQGTEAAAVTTGRLKTTGCRPPRNVVQFVADHPFSFFIMEERSGVIVFAGHVLDPTN